MDSSGSEEEQWQAFENTEVKFRVPQNVWTICTSGHMLLKWNSAPKTAQLTKFHVHIIKLQNDCFMRVYRNTHNERKWTPVCVYACLFKNILHNIFLQHKLFKLSRNHE